MICGSRYETDIIVTGDYARLKFHSDYETQKRGFDISFIAVPKPSEYNQKKYLTVQTCNG